MSQNIEHAINALFPAEGSRVGNVKFFRGLNRNITGEQMADQLNRADAQVAAGESIRAEDIDGDLN